MFNNIQFCQNTELLGPSHSGEEVKRQVNNTIFSKKSYL